MQPIMDALRTLKADPTALAGEPPELASLSDVQLLRATARAIARPKVTRATSFTLHAPLELLARGALLPLVSPRFRVRARLRLAAIAGEYAQGDEIERPTVSFASAAEARANLLAAFETSNAEGADCAISYLAAHQSLRDLLTDLANVVTPLLGAAGHAPILFAGLLEAAAQYGDLSILLRAPVRTLAAEAGARLRWLDNGNARGPADLFEALAAPAHVRSPNVFIAPTMLAVEADGFAESLLSRATAEIAPAEAARALLRIAALSMLQDDPAHAPYGWTHCLSLPQGVMSLAPYARAPRRCLRAAATYVLGFRATLGKVRLKRDWNSYDIEATETLVARAAAHQDAHLAKYTTACFAAATNDPEARGLFLAAATHLGRWWDAHPGVTFQDS